MPPRATVAEAEAELEAKKQSAIARVMGSGGHSLNTEEYLRRVGPLLERAKTLAREYKVATGRPLGITGEVAEYEAVRLLGLEHLDYAADKGVLQDVDGFLRALPESEWAHIRDF